MKTIFNRNVLYGALIALVAASCTNDETASNDNQVAIRVSAVTQAQTRAVDNAWNEDDVIGISMIDPQNKTVIAPYANYNYVTNGDGNFSPAQSPKIIYFPADGKSVSFKAYYPYKADTPASHVLPVSVKEQTSLADIDLMTAEHVSGTSIDDPNVKLHFYHRLAKVLIDLTTDDTGLIDLKDCKLTIKGLKTAASYDLMAEKLTDDNTSEADVNIPIHNGQGEAIWLPRAAGEGVTFEVTTADGGTYVARMDADLELKAGYKHTFHIRLKSTPITVSATIEEWLEGPERKTDVIRLVTGLEDSKGFVANDTLRLYLKDANQSDFGYLSTFEYGTDGKWSTPVPTYWEGIVADPAPFRGATVIAKKLNETQMDDILVSKDVDVTQYTGVNLEMQHAGSRVIIELESTDGTFSTAELNSATIVLPGYLNNGSLDLANGSFVIGSDKANITPEGGIAIFPPQTIANGDLIAQITINGRIYDVKANEADGFEFKAGVSTKLTMNMHKSEVEMSAVITDWTEDVHEFQDVRIATAELKDNGGDLQDGDKLIIYSGNTTDRTQRGEHFTYNEATDKWIYSNTLSPLYWEDIPVTDDIYGFIERPAVSDAPGNYQSADYIVTPNPVANGGGATNSALHLEMKHAVAKVIVMLKSTTYTFNDLMEASVVLPQYTTGGSMNNGIYVPGSDKNDIKLDKLARATYADCIMDSAYLQPQDIAANSTVVKLNIKGRIYEAQKDEMIQYEAGKATTLFITIEKTGLAVSASVNPWDVKPAVEWNDAMFFTVKNSTAKDFKDGDGIMIYKIGGDDKVAEANSSTYNENSITTTTPWYRDDFSTGDKISAVFPNTPTVANGDNIMPWTAAGGNDRKEDVLVATGTVKDNDAEVKLEFNHVLSKVTVNIIAGTGFSTDELEGCTVTLNNLLQEGTINVATGLATIKAAGTRGDISTAKLGTPNPGTNVAGSYEAFILPQTVTVSGKKTLITVELNGQTYEAEITADKDFIGGNNYVYNITLSKTGLSFSASVAPWTDTEGGEITIE